MPKLSRKNTVLCLALSPIALLSPSSLAQANGSTANIDEQLVESVAKGSSTDDRYLALGNEILRLNDRIAALERVISQLLSRQELDQRSIAQLNDELGRLQADVELRLAELTARSNVVAGQESTERVPPDQSLPISETAAVDRFEQAMTFARKYDWPSVELTMGTFIANNPDDPRIPAARYQLGLAYLEQGQAARAAELFLNLFETGAAADFGADNLFALARAMRAIESLDPSQICSVYSEIQFAYGDDLSYERREELLDLRLEGKCI